MHQQTADHGTHTFRGQSMQHAVARLKATLGPDAVIVGTRRGRDRGRRYVEITAVGELLQRPSTPPQAAAALPAMGGRRGASAAYEHTARATQPAELPPLLAALRDGPVSAKKPFAERAAWLAKQIEARQAEDALRQHVNARPRYGEIDAPARPPAPLPQHQPRAAAQPYPQLQPQQPAEPRHAHPQQPVYGHQAPTAQVYTQPLMLQPQAMQPQPAQRQAMQPQPTQQQAQVARPSITPDTAHQPPSPPAAAPDPGTVDALAAMRAEMDELKRLLAAVARGRTLAPKSSVTVGASTPTVSAPTPEQPSNPSAPVSSAPVSSAADSNTPAPASALELAGITPDVLESALAPIRAQLSALTGDENPLRAELDRIRALLDRQDGEPPTIRALRLRLMAAGISEHHAREVAQRATRAVPEATADDGDLLAMVGRTLADDLECAGNDLGARGRRVLAFVGPTGVGKTTTIAKIATRARMAGQRVALITVDTFRMAAVEQLARYADALDAPLRVVKHPEALPETIDAFADCDLVLVDTTGRNPRAADQVNALARYFPAGWGGELVLTLACSTREADLFNAVDAFGGLGCRWLCITKTDETDALGAVYSVARRATLPVSWLTCGQRVPEDLEDADSAVIAARILAGARPGATLARAS